MAREDYIKAYKRGVKEYNARLQRNENPTLPVLDEIVPDITTLATVSLGLMTIPIDRIVGTSSRGRTNAFASNFMPILEWNSEFAMKWWNLYQSVAENGIRQPIIVKEYMNKYYVVEVNKRVSIMKLIGAVTAEAEVTRVIPRRTNEKENKIYFEFLTFYAATGLNEIWFSEEGGFRKLTRLVGKKPGEKWDENEIKDFRSMYSIFRDAFYDCGGKELDMTVSDALLIFLEIYGYGKSLEKMSGEMRDNVKAIWDEMLVKSKSEQVALLMQPDEEAQPRISLSSLLHPSHQKIRAAFLYHHSPMTSGWTYCHDMGRQHVESVFGSKIETTCRTCDAIENAGQMIENLISEDYNVIFTTSPVLLDATLLPSVRHPDVKILNCSLLASYHRVRSYYLRIYEAKFVIGAIAGALAENDRVGYVADYPIYGMPASINAFAIGARLTNPRAKIYLEWSTMKDNDIYGRFRANDVRIISNRDISAPHQSAREFGLYKVEDGGQNIKLAMPAWYWGKLYETILGSIMSGAWKNEPMEGGIHALNYWPGMSGGAIDVFCSRKLDTGTKRLVNFLIESITTGRLNPFSGEICDQHGKMRSTEDSELSPAEIISMDWLADNVIGDFPDYDDLTPDAHPLVKIQGVRSNVKLDANAFSWQGMPGKDNDT